MLRQATVALEALGEGADDGDFYQGKVAAARWFVTQVLPHVHAERSVLEATGDGLMELPETAF